MKRLSNNDLSYIIYIVIYLEYLAMEHECYNSDLTDKVHPLGISSTTTVRMNHHFMSRFEVSQNWLAWMNSEQLWLPKQYTIIAPGQFI